MPIASYTQAFKVIAVLSHFVEFKTNYWKRHVVIVLTQVCCITYKKTPTQIISFHYTCMLMVIKQHGSVALNYCPVDNVCFPQY